MTRDEIIAEIQRIDQLPPDECHPSELDNREQLIHTLRNMDNDPALIQNKPHIKPYLDNVMALDEYGIRREIARLQDTIQRASQSCDPCSRTYKILTGRGQCVSEITPNPPDVSSSIGVYSSMSG